MGESLLLPGSSLFVFLIFLLVIRTDSIIYLHIYIRDKRAISNLWVWEKPVGNFFLCVYWQEVCGPAGSIAVRDPWADWPAPEKSSNDSWMQYVSLKGFVLPSQVKNLILLIANPHSCMQAAVYLSWWYLNIACCYPGRPCIPPTRTELQISTSHLTLEPLCLPHPLSWCDVSLPSVTLPCTSSASTLLLTPAKLSQGEEFVRLCVQLEKK